MITLYSKLRKRIMDKRLEKEVDAEFLKKLKELPFYVAAKKMLGGANNINEPDWFVCVNGRLLLLETKRPGSDKTKKARKEGQRIRAKWWTRARARYVRCSTADDMIEAVRELYAEQESLMDKGEDIY